jgi:hypothetical protein
VLAAACGATPTAPSPSGTAPTVPIAGVEPPSGPPLPPFALTVTPDTIWVGIGRQSGQLDGAFLPNHGIWRLEVRATGELRGSVRRIESVLRDRQGGGVLGSRNQLGPFLIGGNTPVRVVDPLKMYGAQTFEYNFDLGFSGAPADLLTTVVIEDTTGVSWTVEQTSKWEVLAPPAPVSPMNVVVRQNDPASGCPYNSGHGYGFVLDLSWNPPPAGVAVTSYSVSVFDGAGRDLINAAHFPTETRFRMAFCNQHVPPAAERGARFGVRTYHAPSHALSAFAVARFDFQNCREAGVPLCQ